MNTLTVVTVLACITASAVAIPYPYAMAQDAGYGAPPSYEPKGYEPPSYSPPKGYDEPLGRVKMQIYRGPSVLKEEHGYDKVYFAPWGYYDRQPEDAKPYGYH